MLYTGEHTEGAIIGFVDKVLGPSFTALTTLEQLQAFVANALAVMGKRPFVVVRCSWCVCMSEADCGCVREAW